MCFLPSVRSAAKLILLDFFFFLKSVDINSCTHSTGSSSVSHKAIPFLVG